MARRKGTRDELLENGFIFGLGANVELHPDAQIEFEVDDEGRPTEAFITLDDKVTYNGKSLSLMGPDGPGMITLRTPRGRWVCWGSPDGTGVCAGITREDGEPILVAQYFGADAWSFAHEFVRLRRSEPSDS